MKKAMKQSTLVSLLSFGSMLLLAGAFVAIILVYLSNISVTNASEKRFDLTENANRFMGGSAYLTEQVRAYAVTGNRVQYDNYWNEINNLKNRDIGVANMQEIGITDAEQQKINDMAALSNQLVPLEEQAMKDTEKGRTASAMQYVYGDEYSASITKIETIKAEFLEMLDQRTEREVNRLQAIAFALEILAFVLILAVVALQVLTFIIMRKKILAPIAAIETEMGHISRGDLHSEFNLEADTSEIGMLVHAIHSTRATLRSYIDDIAEKLTKMADGDFALTVDMEYIGDFTPIQSALESIIQALSDTITQIRIAAEQVATGSDQVSSGAQALAAGSTEQAAAVEELNATVAEVAKQAEENQEQVKRTTEQLEHTAGRLSVGNQHMDQLTGAMDEISTSSSQIAYITKVIEDIAFQTNILALNAAIEAARAGNAGKGFAVVADEVRNLAAKSADAARQTAELIERSVGSVERGAKIAAETADILHEVGENTARVVTDILAIERVSESQSHAIEQIRDGLDQVSSVVQTNAATAEENSATSEEMSAQATALHQEVGRFKIKGATGARHSAAMPVYHSYEDEEPALTGHGFSKY